MVTTDANSSVSVYAVHYYIMMVIHRVVAPCIHYYIQYYTIKRIIDYKNEYTNHAATCLTAQPNKHDL